MRRRANMWEVNALDMLCLIVIGFALAIACACALLTRIAAAQKSAIGCFVLVGIFCCGLAILSLLVGLGLT
jgi:hypothetical protein